jgi:hypothetical protein
MESASEAGQLVRSYSLELENTLPTTVPVHDVRRVFVDNERQMRLHEGENSVWRKYYEPWKPVEGEDL